MMWKAGGEAHTISYARQGDQDKCWSLRNAARAERWLSMMWEAGGEADTISYMHQGDQDKC